MALFSRSLKPEGDAGIPAANGAADTANGPRRTIGDLLRDTRKSYGGNVDRIAETLRIRAPYLTAIEDSQYDKLPGPVYAQGFVRAYAVHLGLDGEEAIRRFKQEVAGFEVSRDLSFPVPLAERSIPGGTMVLAALILAICGYGLWYYVSTSDRSHPERVSAVPPDLIVATKKPAPDVTAPASTPASVSATSTAPAAEQSSAPTTAATTTAPSPSAVMPPTTTAATAPVAPPPAVPAPVTSTPATPPLASLAPGATIISPGTTQAAPPPAMQTASTPAGTAVPSPTDATPAATAPQTGPRVYGAAPGVPTRIVIRAIKDSWVQVRNGDEVLVQHTLHPGDSVRVPDISGLSLRTGNGTGIQFEIDGKLFKPLSGTVRTVALDADRLAANNGNPSRTVEFNSGSSPRITQ
jgi:cytoskeleton protein RodZ